MFLVPIDLTWSSSNVTTDRPPGRRAQSAPPRRARAPARRGRQHRPRSVADVANLLRKIGGAGYGNRTRLTGLGSQDITTMLSPPADTGRRAGTRWRRPRRDVDSSRDGAWPGTAAYGTMRSGTSRRLGPPPSAST